jgi:hypothetical protein
MKTQGVFGDHQRRDGEYAMMLAVSDLPDEDEPKKPSTATTIRRLLVIGIALACGGAWLYTRYAMKKEALGGECSYDIGCRSDAPRCMKQDIEGKGVCTRPCDNDGDCAADIKCIKVTLDDYDERGRPLEGGYCFPQALLDARRKKKDGGAAAASSAPKADSWLEVPSNPDQLEGDISVDRNGTTTSFTIKGALLKLPSSGNKRVIVDTSSLRQYTVDDDKKQFGAQAIGGGGEAKLTKTDKKDKVAGRDCEIWQIEEPGKPMREACVIKGGSFADPGHAITAWEKELTVRGVFPLRVTEGDKQKLLVTKIDLHPVDASGFAIPKSYKNLAAH